MLLYYCCCTRFLDRRWNFEKNYLGGHVQSPKVWDHEALQRRTPHATLVNHEAGDCCSSTTSGKQQRAGAILTVCTPKTELHYCRRRQIPSSSQRLVPAARGGVES